MRNWRINNEFEEIPQAIAPSRGGKETGDAIIALKDYFIRVIVHLKALRGKFKSYPLALLPDDIPCCEVYMAEISSYRFGEIQVDGKKYNGDIKITDGSVISNWWRAQGHELAVSDIEDILSEAPEILVVGMGLPGYMKVRDELRQHLAATGISLIDESTPEAVATFNRLKKSGKKVAGAFHLTC